MKDKCFFSIAVLFFLFSNCKSKTTSHKEEFPFYRQEKLKDCGPTCLRIICKYYGQNYTQRYLDSITKLDTLKGTSLLHLSDAAEKIGFKTLGVELNFDELSKKAPLPCIVYLNNNHFAVVYKVSDLKVYVSDPGDTLTTYNVNDFCDAWFNPEKFGDSTGVALLFEKIAK
jgi:ATP-binding cassette, subfamily B, bacterial